MLKSSTCKNGAHAINKNSDKNNGNKNKLAKGACSAERAAQAQPLLSAALQNLQAGNLGQAHALYQRVLQIDPKNPDANHFLGVIAHQSGNHVLAEKLIKKALQFDPTMPQAHNNLGVIQKELGKLDEAKNTFLKVVQLKPDYAPAYSNLGAIFIKLEQPKQALEYLNRAIELNPKDVNAYNSLGVIYLLLTRNAESIQCFNKVLKLAPNYAEAHNNLGNVYYDCKNYEVAKECYSKAITLKPSYAEAYRNLGNSLQELGQLAQAQNCFRQALALSPKEPRFILDMGRNFQRKGEYQSALSEYEKILQIDPANTSAYSNMLLLMNYSTIRTKEEVFQLHASWQDHIVKQLAANRPSPRKTTKVVNRRIRIGYISADFFTHSAAFFFEPLLTNHDQNKFEVFCYYNNSLEDQITLRLKSAASHWRVIHHVNDLDVVKQIRHDDIDILVDLSGHTAGSSLKVFVYRPAPIQITWLGYPNTSGLTEMDYRLTDEISDPIDIADRYHTETLIRLPHGFLCYQGDSQLKYEYAPPCETNGFVTFGSFNNLTKITDEVLETWAKLLLAVSNSRILLKCSQLADEETRNRILATFKQFGIDGNRVELLSRVAGLVSHLDLYSKIDIALDPFPYNGTTTTLEALWMGVPTVTLIGDLHAARVGASILTRIGLPDFIAVNQEDYVNRAASMANQTAYLGELRRTLRARTANSDLCNAPQFAKDIEQVFEDLIAKHSSI